MQNGSDDEVLDLDTFIEEVKQTVQAGVDTLNYLYDLKARGVDTITAVGYEPVVPDNVVQFPTTRTLQ